MYKLYKSLTNTLKWVVGDKQFSVTFIKKNGDVRYLVGTFNPKHWGYTETTNGKGLNWNPTERGYLVVFDLAYEGYRMVNLNTIKDITINGEKKKIKNFDRLVITILLHSLMKFDDDTILDSPTEDEKVLLERVEYKETSKWEYGDMN